MQEHRILRSWLSLVVAWAIFVSGPAAAQAKVKALTDEEVSEAIQVIKDFLYEAQADDGGWYGSFHDGPNDGEGNRNAWGPTAMALLALIVSGESPQHPDIKKGLELLAQNEITGTYALSMRAHLWSYLPPSIFGELLKKDADSMYRTAHGLSRFNYIVAKPDDSRARDAGGRIDNSTTQYGILALWQASKRGINIPEGFWVDAIENFLGQQSDHDGGWAYSGNRATSQTMTCAGLTVLYVAQQELFRGEKKPTKEMHKAVQASIEKGLGFLDKHFDSSHTGHGGNGYLFYGYERVALASGRKYFGGKDWFQDMARRIIAEKGRYGGAIHEAAFHLMFLTRGRVPVWINKLEVPGADWNNRPNDVYFLNRFISEYREHEVNWQVVNVDSSPPEDWISAPLMWLSSDGKIDWTDEQVAKIKEYLDLGGTLICNTEGRDAYFRKSVDELAERMYPELKFTNMERGHPMATLLEGDPRGKRNPDIRILTNGARVLMIMPKDDWGMKFQADEKPDPDRSPEWRNIINIYGVVTDRGELTPRLNSTLVQREARGETGAIKVVIPKWEDPAGRMPETDIYRVMRNYMHNMTGKQLDIQHVPFSELATVDPALLHMVGVEAVEVKPAEREAIQAFLKTKGTVLIENLGGTSDFANSLREQLGTMFPGTEERVSTRKPIISGRGLPEGSQNNRRPIFRRLVLERANAEGRLLLRGFADKGRYPVLLSYEDLSLGMLGVKQYGINGYSVETSRNLMVNILIEADLAKKGQLKQAGDDE